MTPKAFDDLYREAETHEDYWVAGAVHEFTEALCRRMDEQRLSRVDLARRLGTSPAYVTKILRGNANFTLATMARLAQALGSELRFQLAPARDLKRERTAPTSTGTKRDRGTEAGHRIASSQ